MVAYQKIQAQAAGVVREVAVHQRQRIHRVVGPVVAAVRTIQGVVVEEPHPCQREAEGASYLERTEHCRKVNVMPSQKYMESERQKCREGNTSLRYDTTVNPTTTHLGILLGGGGGAKFPGAPGDPDTDMPPMALLSCVTGLGGAGGTAPGGGGGAKPLLVAVPPGGGGGAKRPGAPGGGGKRDIIPTQKGICWFTGDPAVKTSFDERHE